MKNKSLILLVVLFACQSVLAQQVMEISGRVVTQGTEETLPFANITAYAPNDSLTAGTLSDEKGRFTLKCDCSDNSYLIISYLGMEPQRITVMQWQGTRRNFGKIALSPSATMLETVTVTDTTPVIDRRFDRTVVKIEETRKATSHTIYDILRSLPGLAVDESGNMVYNGTTPSVYVDDSLSDLKDAPDPWTPAYDGTTITYSTKHRLHGGYSYDGESWRVFCPSIRPASNTGYRAYGFRMAFLPK